MKFSPRFLPRYQTHPKEKNSSGKKSPLRAKLGIATWFNASANLFALPLVIVFKFD